jgi:hypothetical protein
MCLLQARQSWAKRQRTIFIFPGALIAHKFFHKEQKASVSEFAPPPFLLLSKKNFSVLAKLYAEEGTLVKGRSAT